MKVIEKHTDHVAWWAGRKINCYNCRSIVELESSDNPDPKKHYLKGHSSEHFDMPCVVCGVDFRVSRTGPPEWY